MSRLETYGRIFRMLGLQWWAQRTTPRPNIRVTYTHEVKSQYLENFESLIAHLKEVRAFITPGEFFDFYRGGFSPPGPSILMTFDDGRMSSYTAAKKILNPRGIKAIFFVPTAVLELKTHEQMKHFLIHNVNGGTPPPWPMDEEDYLVLTADAIRDLVADGHLVLPHTHSHVNLKDIQDESAANRELWEPKRILADLLHREIPAMSIPVGTDRQGSAYAYRKIRETYEFCFTALAGANSRATAPHYLNRDCLSPTFSWSYAAMVMGGAYDVYYRMKMHRLKKLTRESTWEA
jgi:peptidoglycan/xylan/chitin deacetylase (PgdA/CDA1 family)